MALEVLANPEVAVEVDGNGMISRIRPSLASEKALVVSRDMGLARKLQGFLQQDHGCDADCVNSYFDAEQRLRGSGRQCVFLDLRPDNYQEDPSSLLDFLVRQDRRRTPVVSIGCDGYRCEWGMALSNLSSFLPRICDGTRRLLEGGIFSDVSVGSQVERERRSLGW